MNLVLGMLRNPGNRLAIGAVVLLGLLALLQHWLVNLRPVSPELRAAREFDVTSPADRGPGSLREAIFAADTAPQRARIVLRTPRVLVHSPLPPLVNPLGIVIESGVQLAEVDGGSIGNGPVFDVDAPDSVISGIRISNASEQAILVRADGFRLLNANLANCDEGLHAVAGVKNLVIEKSSFQENRIGVWLTSAESGVILRNNRFHGHKDAAIWVVRGSGFDAAQGSKFEIQDNHFEEDRMSIVLGNIPALVENNEFLKAREAAVYLIGQGAIVRNNRIRDGAGIGVFAQTSQGTVIENNEMDHNRALAVLIRSSSNDLVQKNRLYDNGYGIAFVLGERERPNVAVENSLLGQQYDGMIVIGNSPVLKNNRSMNNRLAGLRILDFFPLTGTKVASEPFLDHNTIVGNKFNEPIHGEYRVRKSEKEQ